MNWTEITVSVPLEYTDTAAAIANMTVPYGIYIEDYSDLEQGAEEIAHIDLIDEELVKRDRTKSIIHIYISECDNAEESLAFLKERLTAEKIPFDAGASGVKDSDWNENWKKYFHATEIGKRLAIAVSYTHLTGTHATTSLCLAMLENYVTDGSKMLDIGCGSGILSIAAVLLGAESAVGVDIDAQSVKTARENAELNSQSGKTEYIVGDLADKVSGKFNVVCANIVADVVIRLLESVRDYIAENAVLLVSGIIDARKQDVLLAAEKHGFAVKEKQYKDNWCAFALI